MLLSNNQSNHLEFEILFHRWTARCSAGCAPYPIAGRWPKQSILSVDRILILPKLKSNNNNTGAVVVTIIIIIAITIIMTNVHSVLTLPRCCSSNDLTLWHGSLFWHHFCCYLIIRLDLGIEKIPVHQPRYSAPWSIVTPWLIPIRLIMLWPSLNFENK